MCGLPPADRRSLSALRTLTLACAMLSAAAGEVSAANLYRLRSLPVAPPVEGGQTTATICLDNSPYPPEPSPNPRSHTVSAFTFGVAIAPPLELAGASLDSAVLAATGGDPLFFSSINEVSGGVNGDGTLNIADPVYLLLYL